LREEFGKWESALYEVVIATCYAALTAGENWWTRSQSIRTLAQIPIEVPLLDPVQTRKYQEIASEVLLLRKLGLPVYKIAHLSVWPTKPYYGLLSGRMSHQINQPRFYKQAVHLILRPPAR